MLDFLNNMPNAGKTNVSRWKNALAKKNIENIYQLHRWCPLRYIDNTTETGVFPDLDGMHAVVIGQLLDVVQGDMRARKGKYTKVVIQDRKSGEKVRGMIFAGGRGIVHLFERWIRQDVILAGTLQYDKHYGYSICGPDTFSCDVKKNLTMIPIYSKVKGLSEDTLKNVLAESLSVREEETIPEEIRTKYSLCEINQAVEMSLFPNTAAETLNAKKRFLFDDMYYLAGRLEARSREAGRNGIRITTSEITDQIIQSLPYTLTEGQMETYQKIREMMLHGDHVRALVQGDVGCGKTITAFLAMLLASENGYQAAIMAPTKILAVQHYEKLQDLIKGTGLTAALVTSEAMKKKDLKEIANGNAKLVVGTHSLLSDKVEFKNLGILVIDEEHKFGVAQREKIEQRQREVGTISMSATPIPRTLATSLYGNDTTIFSIKSKPAGRKAVITVYDDGRGIRDKVRFILSKGQQVYVVCPMIAEAEDNPLLAKILSTSKAMEIYRSLFPGVPIAELTGLNTPEETDHILSDFRSGKTKILISTTVVEVGVDVPNATLIIIHNAERFGLAGMHQLRGRVGRGDQQSYCCLVSGQNPMENERLQTLISTTDGFEIAEKDLTQLRKSGDLFGEEQSGRNRYIEEMIMYPKLFQAVKEIVKGVDTKLLEKHSEKMLLGEIKGHMKPICLQ